MIFSRMKLLLAPWIFLGIAGCFWIFPAVCVQGFGDGLQLCAQSLLPALFPFFVISTLLLESPAAFWLAMPLRPLCRLLGLRSGKAPLLLLLGWLGGYTALAAGLAQCCQQQELSPKEAGRLLAAGTVCSPGFTAAVGGLMLGRPVLGVMLYACQLAAGLVCGLALRWLCPQNESSFCDLAAQPAPTPQGLAGAIGSAVQNSLQVCGSVVFFRMVLALGDQILFTPLSRAVLAGLLEISSGCRSWAALAGTAALRGCCGSMSILSLSVWCQLKALSHGRYSLGALALTRPLQLVLSQTFLYIAVHIFPQDISAAAFVNRPFIVYRRLPGDRALLLFLFCCLVLDRLEKASLYKKSRKFYNK